jgi:hypothetical protein
MWLGSRYYSVPEGPYTLEMRSATVGHSLNSTPMDGRGFTALGLTLAVTILVLTEVDVLIFSERATELALAIALHTRL